MLEIEHLALSNLLIYILLALTAQVISAQSFESNKLLQNGIHKLLNENYESAAKTFKEFGETDSTLMSQITLLTVEVFRREHLADYTGASEIDSSFNSLQDSLESILDENHEDLTQNYILALLKSLNAYWEAFQENFLEAFADGFIASQYFEKCMTLDSNSVEFKCALGNYDYWSSVKTESLHWLPFVEDNKKEGLKQLELCKNADFLLAEFMKISLAWAYLNEDELDQAQTLIKELRKSYPNSIKIKLLQGEFLKNIDPKKAIKIFQETANYYESLNSETPTKLIEIYQKLATLYIEVGEPEEALSICYNVISLPIEDGPYAEYLKPKLEEFVKLKDELEAEKMALPEK